MKHQANTDFGISTLFAGFDGVKACVDIGGTKVAVSVADTAGMRGRVAEPTAKEGPSDALGQQAQAQGAAAQTLPQWERDMLLQALQRAQWNVSRAARELGISRDTLRYRIEKHDLTAQLPPQSPPQTETGS